MDNIIIPIIILSLVAILFLLASINNTHTQKKRKSHIYSKLENLYPQIESEDVIARRDAVIRLDNLLSKAFQARYNNNKSCADNLKDSKRLFKKNLYQELWDVHKLRNEIVHNDVDISISDAKEVFKIYKLSISNILK
jgi:uncharacterized protein YutE (UPF0331/DUF86 family)